MKLASNTLIEAKNLSVGYSKNIVAKNINFTINKDDVVCVLGHNGAGKSTLIKTILRIIKPRSGELIYGDSIKDLRFGYLPQMSESQEDFPAVVEEIVLSGCISRSKFKLFFNKEDKQIAKKNMELLDIDKFAKQPFNTLSGGQKQRVLIARALCATNNIIFLDEPLSGLDPKIITDFYKIVEELHNNHITVVMISHETVESIALSSHVLFIGEESKYLSKEEFLSSDLGKQYLGD